MRTGSTSNSEAVAVMCAFFYRVPKTCVSHTGQSGISKGITDGLDQKPELIMALVSVRSRQSPSLMLFNCTSHDHTACSCAAVSEQMFCVPPHLKNTPPPPRCHVRWGSAQVRKSTAAASSQLGFTSNDLEFTHIFTTSVCQKWSICIQTHWRN